MTKLKNLGAGVIILGIAAIACLTNPGKTGYRQYANSMLKTEFKERICPQVAEDLGQWLESQCYVLVNTASPYLADVVEGQTERQNFLLFSIYQANLPLPSPLPTYQIETLGILGSFYTYQAKKL